LPELLRLLSFNNRYNEKNSNAYRYIIYNDSYKDVDNLLDKEKITDNKYIITTRDESDWKKSIVKFKDTNPNEYNILIKKNINQYISQIYELFEKEKCLHNLLILDIFEMKSSVIWEKMISFLELDRNKYSHLIKTPFPNININSS
jgi:hypothetical protein